jgi:hypothetical protein
MNYGLDDRGSRVRCPEGAENFSLYHRVQWGPPTSYPMGTGALSLGMKRPGREADDSPPSSAEIKNAWSYTSTPPYVFMAWCVVKHRNNSTSTYLLFSTLFLLFYLLLLLLVIYLLLLRLLLLLLLLNLVLLFLILIFLLVYLLSRLCIMHYAFHFSNS